MTAHRRFVWWGLLSAGLLLAVSIAQAAPPQQGAPDRLAYGQTVRGRLSSNSPEDLWRFDGQAGDLVLIDMRASEPNDLDTYLTLRDSQGATLVTDDDGGEGLNSRIGPFELPATGSYTVAAARYSGTGDYTLQVMYLSTIPTITPGKPLVGVVNSSQPNNYFLFVADPDAAGDLLRVDVQDDLRYSDPHLSIYGPDDLIISTEYQRGATLDPFVPDSGAAYVIVVSWNSEGTGGPYELTLTPSKVELLADGEPQSGVLGGDTHAQWHYLRAARGDQVRVTVRAEADVIAPALEITTLDRTQTLYINEGDATRAISVLLAMPADGVYAVRVGDALFQDTTASYTLLAAWETETQQKHNRGAVQDGTPPLVW